MIECDCGNFACFTVYWFRTNSNHNKLQYLGKCNNANVATLGAGVESSRFDLNRRNSVSFTLRIVNVTKDDAGIYSCILGDIKNNDMWKSGILLQPGGLYAEISSTSFTAVKYQVLHIKRLCESEFRWQMDE